MRKILIVFAMLVAWKVLRTDWLVVCPWWTDPAIGSGGIPSGFHDATFQPPVSPAWRPPDPMKSGILGFGSGASFPIGTPWVRPYWELIGFKIGFPLMLICSVPMLRFFIGEKGLVTKFVRELIDEVKKTNPPSS